jgi:metal transporter CNNM
MSSSRYPAVIDDDTILVWAKQKRIITGADILGRLLRGIAEKVESQAVQKTPPS